MYILGQSLFLIAFLRANGYRWIFDECYFGHEWLFSVYRTHPFLSLSLHLISGFSGIFRLRCSLAISGWNGTRWFYNWFIGYSSRERERKQILLRSSLTRSRWHWPRTPEDEGLTTVKCKLHFAFCILFVGTDWPYPSNSLSSPLHFPHLRNGNS